jgi:hypothetical protein
MSEPLKTAGPLLGYNNNIPYRGHVYHVQTEDSGSRRPHVITHLFADGGRIVKTTKTSYAEFVGSENVSERVRSLMRDQHKRMVIALRDGHLDDLLADGAVPIVEELPAPSAAAIKSNEGSIAEPVSVPIELTERSPSLDDNDFVREVQELVPGTPGSERTKQHISEPSPGSYSYVGRRSSLPTGGSLRPSSEPPPPTPRRGSPGTPPTGSKLGKKTTSDAPPAIDGAAPRRIPRPGPDVAFDDRPTTPFSLGADGQLQGTFGERYVSDRRLDEVVIAFLRRDGLLSEP